MRRILPSRDVSACVARCGEQDAGGVVSEPAAARILRRVRPHYRAVTVRDGRPCRIAQKPVDDEIAALGRVHCEEGAVRRECRRGDQGGDADRADIGDLHEERLHPGLRVQQIDGAGLFSDQHRGIADRRDRGGIGEAGGDAVDGDPLFRIGHRHRQRQRGGCLAVADADLDQIDIVAIGVGRKVVIGRRDEGQLPGRRNREARGIRAARNGIAQRVAIGIGRACLIDRAGRVFDDADGRRRAEDRWPVGLSRRGIVAACRQDR